MPDTTIYHNPHCSKSRQALEILRERGETFDVVKYLSDTPSVTELDSLCRKLGVEPHALMRTKERRFQELGLSLSDTRDRSEWLQILNENPVLLERPIVVRGNKAIIGRPPERIVEIL